MRPKGFTVAELLVVTSIFVVLFAVSITNYRQAEKIETLRITGQQMTTDISWAQTASITGTSSDHGMGSAYGIVLYLNTNKYKVFRDDNGSKAFEPNVDRVMKTVTFSSDLTVSQLKLGTQDAGQIEAIFLPPRPVLYVNGVLSQAISVKISRLSGSDKSVLIEVDPVTGRSKQSFVTN